MNRRKAARLWTAPVLWRFDNGRNLAPAVSNVGSQSARGLAQSMTLARQRWFMGAMRNPSVGGILTPALSHRERENVSQRFLTNRAFRFVGDCLPRLPLPAGGPG